MLGKLIKHEFSATSRIFLPLYMVLAALTLVNRVTLAAFEGDNPATNILKALLTTAYVFSIIAVLVATILVMIQRFYKNLMGDEGYLMFTLPASSTSLINAKLIASVCWILISVVAVIASLMGLFFSPQTFEVVKIVLRQALNEMNNVFGSSSLLLSELGILIILSTIYFTMMVYTSISIGQLFNSHKLLASFGAYVVLNMITQFAAGILALVFGFSMGADFNDPKFLPLYFFPVIMVYITVMSSALYLATRYILKNRLNLE